MPVARLTEFLARRTAERFCPACLASGLGISVSDVRAATRTIANETGLAHEVATCAACGRETVVYGVRPAEAKAPRKLVAEFFQQRPGRGVCQACLTRMVKAPLESVQKAVWQLKGEGRVRTQSGPCGICEHSRALVMPTQLLR